MLLVPRSSSGYLDRKETPQPIGGSLDPVAEFLRELYRGVRGDASMNVVVDELRPRYDALTNALGEGEVFEDLVRLFTIRREELHAALLFQDRLWGALELLG